MYTLPKYKKGASMGKAFGFLFALLVIIYLVPTVFDSSTGLGNTSLFGGAPSWVYTLILLGACVGIVKLVVGGRR